MINQGFTTNPKKLKDQTRCIHEFEREINEVLWYHFIPEAIREATELIETNCFVIRPYSWDIPIEDAKDIPIEDVNNWHFWHKGSNFKLQWYKYPLRSPMVNYPITHEEFLEILKDCWNFWQRDHTGISYYSAYKWWTRIK